jgi:hypothetical protein
LVCAEEDGKSCFPFLPLLLFSTFSEEIKVFDLFVCVHISLLHMVRIRGNEGMREKLKKKGNCN